jgi:hypothetical protein
MPVLASDREIFEAKKRNSAPKNGQKFCGEKRESFSPNFDGDLGKRGR